MYFKTIKDKCEYYRELSDYRLIPYLYVVIMLDGRSFSKKVKNKFDKPFDRKFVEAMNETMKHLCENIQGAMFGYCQSDEISIVVSDTANERTDTFFSYRLCKLQSLCASMATARFNNVMGRHFVEKKYKAGAMTSDISRLFDDMPLYEFDCKAWNVPNGNDAFAWLLYRQHDCVRNSKQQVCQTYIPHKELVGKNTDEQCALLVEKNFVDWNNYTDGLKFGRMCYREHVILTKTGTDGDVEYERAPWVVKDARVFGEDKDRIMEIIANKESYES